MKNFSKTTSVVLVIFCGLFMSINALMAEQSMAPLASDVVVTNNVKKSDTIYIGGLAPKDVVTVYNIQGKKLTSKTVSSNKTDLTISLSQLGTSASSIGISVTTKGFSESEIVMVDFAAETISDTLQPEQVEIVNNADMKDVIYVSGLTESDVIKVYNAAVGGRLLSQGKVGKGKDQVTISIGQLSAAAGSIYMSLTASDMLEGERIQMDYGAEKQTEMLSASNIEVTNNLAGKKDTVYVSGLDSGSTVTVYNAASDGNKLGSAKCSKNKTEVTINISQLGKTAGSVYISVKNVGFMESDRLAVYYDAEDVTPNIPSSDIMVVNNASGTKDTIYVTNLFQGDVIKVYTTSDKSTLWAKGTVASGKEDVTISVAQLGVAAGAVWVTNTRSGMNESASRTKAEYSAEKGTGAISADSVLVTNNSGVPDTIQIFDCIEKSTVYAYTASIGGDLLGSALVEEGRTTATITISQLGINSGIVYVSAKGINAQESARVAVVYDSEEKTEPLNAADIVVTNNAVGIDDMVQVVGLSPDDTIRVYEKSVGGVGVAQLGTAVATASDVMVTISIPQLGTPSGSVYVTKKSKNKSESTTIEVYYDSEEESDILDVGDIIVTNNANADSTVFVKGITAGDVIKVYDNPLAGTMLGSATVPKGDSKVTITIEQLDVRAGVVYVSRTSPNQIESTRVMVNYNAEGVSQPIDAHNVSTTNNAGIADTIYVVGLNEYERITVYQDADGTRVLGSAMVPADKNAVTISIAQLGRTAGTVYLSVTQENKSESSYTAIDYLAEKLSNPIEANNVEIVNNAGSADTISVTGLALNDVVTIYKTIDCSSAIGSGKATDGATHVTISIDQVGSAAGTVYITVTSENKAESEAVTVGYAAEVKSEMILENNISVTNKYGMASTLTARELDGGTIVRVYDKSLGGALLGSGTVDIYSSTTTISLSSLLTEGGYVYVSVTSRYKLESDRTAIAYSGKTVTNPPSVDCIEVVNNAGIADTVTVSGLEDGDVVNIYSSEEKNGTLLGSTTTASGKMEATVTVTQLGKNGGTIYVSLTSSGKFESSVTAVSFIAESQTQSPTAGSIEIFNYSNVRDEIVVNGLLVNDVVSVYAQAEEGTAIGTATVASGASSATIYVSQLGKENGCVYVSVKSIGKTESVRTVAEYQGESSAPTEAQITIQNKVGIADTITVTGLSANDIVKVYDSATGGRLLGSANVSAGATSVTISVSQLTTSADCVYISVTSYGRCESARAKAAYLAEESTNPLYVGFIEVYNNPEGISDQIVVTNLSVNDVIKVYDSLEGGSLLGSATVTSGTTANITIKQLGSLSDSVYISVTSLGKYESSRIKVDYAAE